MATLFNVPVKRMLVVALVLLIGCRDGDKNSSLIFEELNESLERSNRVIENSTRTEFNDLKNKSNELAMAERAAIWIPKAKFIQEESQKTIDSLSELISKMNSKSDEEKYKGIGGILKRYKENILNCDSLIRQEFRKQRLFLNNNLPNNIIVKGKSELTKLKNDVRNIENAVVTYCNNQVGMVDGPGYYESFSAIAAANSTRLGVGEEIIITTGVAQFSKMSNPSFLINGKAIPANDRGVGEYKMKVSNKPGKYKVPVKISFTKENGKPEVLEKDIEYTVVE